MTSTSEHAVTVLISRQVKQDCEAEFERVMDQIIAVAATFKGHLGAQLVRPGDEQGVYDSLYHIVLAFDNESNLKIWQNSPARSLGLAAAAPFIEGQALVRQVSGLALWFQPTGPKQVPPPRWKVAVVTWIGIFPTAYMLFFVLGDMLVGLAATDTYYAFNGACCRFDDLGCCPSVDSVVQAVALLRLKGIGNSSKDKRLQMTSLRLLELLIQALKISSTSQIRIGSNTISSERNKTLCLYGAPRNR